MDRQAKTSAVATSRNARAKSLLILWVGVTIGSGLSAVAPSARADDDSDLARAALAELDADSGRPPDLPEPRRQLSRSRRSARNGWGKEILLAARHRVPPASLHELIDGPW
jgi:hypothetical protein